MTKRELSAIAGEVSACTKCRLCRNRTLAVPGEGPSTSRIMLVGEAPGKKEDISGRPFVGQAGRILEKALASAGLERDEVFITSVVKCRPPGNREPMADEMEACRDYLRRQADALRPSVVILLGRVAQLGVTGMKGNLQRGPAGGYRNAKLYVTYHPAVALHGRPQLLEALSADLRAAALTKEEKASQR